MPAEPRTAIVVEGGAMRGIFAAGVLDVLFEARLAPFEIAIGSSAGACNLASYVAGQHDRNRRCFLTQMRRAEFVDARRFLRGGHWLDLDYLWEAFDREDPLDVAAAVAGPTKLVVATTSVETGRAIFFEPAAAQLNEVLRASSAVPLMYRRFVELGGRPYTDGGLAAPIPVEEAYRRGARRVLVIRSRPVRFAGPSRFEGAVAAVAMREYPALAKALLGHPAVYRRALAFIRRPPADCTVVEVAPDHPFRTKRTTRDARVLAADYARGRLAGMRAIRAWAGVE